MIDTPVCCRCKTQIVEGEPTARGPDGVMHYRCFKVGKAHGTQLSDAEAAAARARGLAYLTNRWNDYALEVLVWFP